MTAGALTGLRVLDLADQTGALAGRLLAGLGADVVLLEPPGGSGLRGIPPFLEGATAPERSLFFWFYSAGKRSLVCDPATPEGAALLGELAARADVLIETGAPGSTDDLLYNTGAPATGSASGSPKSSGYIAELDWLPRRDLRMALQYTGYREFNGARSNYDGFGRNAKDNNTLYFVVWWMI